MKSGEPRVAPTPIARIVQNPYTCFFFSMRSGLLNLRRRDWGSDDASETPEMATLTIAITAIAPGRFTPCRASEVRSS